MRPYRLYHSVVIVWAARITLTLSLFQRDTLILLAAQGGTWNYFRRPVWVVITGGGSPVKLFLSPWRTDH